MNLKGFSNYKIIIKNTGYLSVLEILKLIMPFIALPYIIRTVGGEKYGLVIFIQTIISYFSVFINFGLDISAVKNVAIYKKSKRQLSLLVSSVLSLKFLLWLISSLFIGLGFLLFPSLRANYILVIFSFLSCFADVLFPLWYFQGIEKMKYITLIRFVSILFYTVSIFIFIRTADDYIYIPLLQSLGALLSGFLSIYILLKSHSIRLKLVPVTHLKKYFIEAIPFFVSRLSLIVNSGIAKIICGIFFSMASVAAFDLAQKIATTAIIPLQMVNQSIYPHLARTKDRLLAKNGFFFITLCSLLLSFFIFLVAPLAVRFFAGSELMEAVPLLRILCFYILFGGVSLYLGTPLLVAFGYPKPFNWSVILSTMILIVCYFVMYVFNVLTVYNFAYAMGITELFIVLYRLSYCYKNNILYLWSPRN